MNPNKKIVNPKNTTNNSPWVLCPSKSFPGKFYYFNGSTGETAWTLNETDNKNLKKGTIHRVTDKAHPYPEPFGPPADESTNTTSSSSFIKKSHFVNSTDFGGRTNFSNRTNFGNISNWNNSIFSRGTNTSNGTKFSNEPSLSHGHYGTNLGFETNSSHRTNLGPGISYHSDVSKQFQCFPSSSPSFGEAVFPKYITNEPFTPKVIWALTPMIVLEQPTHRQTLDQAAQYEPQETFLQCAPSVHRFQNLNVQGNPFQLHNFNSSTLEPTFGQKCKIIRSKETNMFVPKPQTKEEACQTHVTKSKQVQTLDSDAIGKSAEKVATNYVENTLNKQNKIDSGIEETGVKFSSLDENDLRFLLVAKKRKPVDLLDALKSNKDTTKQLESQSNDNRAPVKRVTFLLDDRNSSPENVQSNGNQTPDSSRLEDTGAGDPTGDVCYIAVDTSVLLTEFKYIEKFVQSDEKCCLLIPYAVKLKVEIMSRGEFTGGQNLFAARQILRTLATPAPHIVVQNKPDEVRTFEDSILECCWRLLQDDCHVILITNNTKLSNLAKTIDLECHTIEEIKDAVHPTTSRQEDLTKVKIVFDNDEKRSENLFKQNISEFNPFRISQNVEIPVHSIRKNLFDTEDENVFRGKDKDTDKLINLTDARRTSRNVSHPVVDQISSDIKKLDITDHLPTNQRLNDSKITNDQAIRLKTITTNQINNRYDIDTIKVNGMTKLNSVFDLDDELAMFVVKTVEMENRVNIRKDEWVCRLIQTMEGALTDILLKEKVKPKIMLPPWTLYEAIQLTGEKFKNQPKLNIIIQRFCLHLLNCSSNRGKLNRNIKPADFIKLVGYSMILIQNLKEFLDYVELSEADDLLSELIKHIEDPTTDVELALDRIITPILNSTDMDFETKMPVGYKKKQSDVLDYLKKHFAAMESYEIEKVEPKIVRTVGKDLKTLKINNTKSISIDNTENLLTDEVSNVVVEPKVIRNVTVIDAFEERLKRQTEIDLDRLDYEKSFYTNSFESDEELLDNNDEIEDAKNLYHNIDKIKNFKETSELLDMNNECVVAYPLMKHRLHLTELRRTLLLTYNFINETVHDYRQDISEDRLADKDFKINMAHKYILNIIDKLKSIIARESRNGPTLRELLIQAGDYVGDEETSGYKQMVAQYLEQAQILKDALDLMVTLTHEKPVSISTNGVAYHETRLQPL